MTSDLSDRTLCESPKLQAELIREAYASGQPTAIDNALIRVTDARRMVSSGMYDLLYADDPRYPDDAQQPSDN